MKAKIIKVMEENWDYLIVLDACRYDYFSNMYQNYFLGELEKGISLGSSTSEWLERSFPNYYSDIIYISGNPYINSKIKIEGFDAKKHFYKILDVWDFGWSENLNTVPPKNINESTLNLLEEFSEKRFIIHYLQPHEPYLSKKYSIEDLLKQKYKNGLKWDQAIWAKKKSPIEKLLHLSLVKTKIMKNTWKIREIFNLSPIQPMDAVRRIYGISGLRDAYKENLRIVLDYVAELCQKILSSQKYRNIVITADHGELLGENGDFCHNSRSKNPILLEVPFFRVRSVVGTQSQS